MTANIIQAEFFHGDYDAADLNGFFYSLSDRLADSVPIKTVVRFYDTGNAITVLTQSYQEADSLKERALEKEFFSYYDVQRQFWCLVRQWRFYQLERCRRALHDHIALCLWQANKERLALATETQDHHFRKVRDDERHELVESVRAAKQFWVFVFKPNNLFADENEIIARAM